MRWKLLFVAPLLAAAAAIGAVALWLRLTRNSDGGSPLNLVLLLGPPLMAAAAAGVFVYRHTPRRRVLQAVASVLLSLALCFVALLAAARHFFRY